MITLQPMAEPEFQAYKEKSIPEYAEEHVLSGNWDPAEALERARRDFEHFLPDGIQSENNYLWNLVNDAGQRVGLLWYRLELQRPVKSAFVLDFVIDEAFRRRGYGEAALRALEAEVCPLGVRKLELHVFAHNAPARALYRKAGFEETDLWMRKRLPDE